jgi:tetratricopeptide (TPR) repeat protein
LRRTSFLASLGCAAISSGSNPPLAGDPAPPSLEATLSRARALADEERWAEAEAALRRVFVDFPDDPRVRARLREIEDQLKVSMFRKSQPPLKGADLFGAPCVKFSPSTRDVEFQFASFEPPLWSITGESLRLCSVRFDGPLTVEIRLSYLDSSRHVAGVFLCYDVEKRGGYMLSPGYFWTDGSRTLSAPPSIHRIGVLGDVALPNSGGGSTAYGDDAPLKITRTGADIVAKVGSDTVVKASDSTYTSGLLAIRAETVRSVSIKGRIDKHAFRKMVAERYAGRFAAWEESTYDREKEIPEWARESVVAAPDMTLAELPSDARAEGRSRLAATVEAAAERDVEAAFEAQMEAASAPPNTALYLRGVADLAVGRYKSAESAFDRLAAAEPEFAPARMFRGVARFRLRRMDEARADLAWTLERRPRAVEANVAAAMMAVFEQDFARADAVLAKARELGVSGPRLDEIADWVHRVKAGPNFAQRFESQTEHFVVRSDHSQKVCFEAAKLLESMQLSYAGALRPAPSRGPKSRVYVFSGPQGYFDYAADLGLNVHSSAGVYIPKLRELAIWIPNDMTDFNDTVRHEGFHQYLHRLVDDAPTWFNEGYASVMGGGGPEGLRDDRRDGEFVKKFVPVKDLVAMRQPAFLKNAGVTYTQSRYLVDFLRRTKVEKLKNVLADYFAGVADGLSQDEVNAKVLTPVMDLLETEFQRSR